MRPSRVRELEEQAFALLRHDSALRLLPPPEIPQEDLNLTTHRVTRP
jgi:hypothetical protein